MCIISFAYLVAEGFIIKTFNQFIKHGSSSSVLLLISSLIAMLWANSAWQAVYFYIFHQPISIAINNNVFTFSINSIINDGLMTIFFLFVTLEVKRELLIGELNTVNKALLPVIAAIGGMLLPALIYLFLNVNHLNGSTCGWAIPTATDIAFSLAILMLLKSYVPSSLKVFLTALAIIDDLGAIVIIAVLYTHNLQTVYILLVLFCMLCLLIFNVLEINNYSLYFIVGIALWILILKSGIHATIAGVILGFFIPLKSNKKNFSPLQKLEHFLQPWVAYGVLPLFALANTGLSFKSIGIKTLFHPVTLGICLGLFLGKQLGIFLASWLSVKARWVKLPTSVHWGHVYGMSIICGIGFTMSLFIGRLSFENQLNYYENLVKLGVFSGSLLSGVVGAMVLWIISFQQKEVRLR